MSEHKCDMCNGKGALIRINGERAPGEPDICICPKCLGRDDWEEPEESEDG